MGVAFSKVSSKSQTVLPKEVRDRLALRPGDTLRYTIDNDRIVIEKASPERDDPFAAFTEWGSEEDDRLYRDL